MSDKTMEILVCASTASEFDDEPQYVRITIDQKKYQQIKKLQQQIVDGLGIGMLPTEASIALWSGVGDFFTRAPLWEKELQVVRNAEDAEEIFDYIGENIDFGEMFEDGVPDPSDELVCFSDCEKLVINSTNIWVTAYPKYGKGWWSSDHTPISVLDEFFGGEA